ncbi:MAG TPA: CRISPR-associated endonuclease Cas3'' [Vicinamibacterales bacterium]|nr:CRISPR-associated endonuclease Cas3'' [Vicinamibacterales bacterium]
MNFKEFFENVTGYKPHVWQRRLASDCVCKDRLIRIPTGFGKTAGVTLAWLWNRVALKNPAWPRRLVLCLPMRTLVEQVQSEVGKWLDQAQKELNLEREVPLHVLMGGLSPSDWHLAPDQYCVLVGTQDMLLSRALNRGYGSGRARWPMEYGLLNVDCLWVMDEIQLMGIGLATSAQLQAFAASDEQAGKLPRARRTWWMSATLQRDWLKKAPALCNVDSLPIVELEPQDRSSDLWAVRKSIHLEPIPPQYDAAKQRWDDKAVITRWAELVKDAHQQTNNGITLVIANTVRSAVELYNALKPMLKGVDLRLVHSRYRGEERKEWARTFLGREHCRPGQNRVIVATQVVEAGVDVSADVLVTEIAPWASLVQRFGRCARYGGTGQIIVVDRRHTDESYRKIKAKDDDERAKKREDDDKKTVSPYELGEIEAASEAIKRLSPEAGPAALEAFEEAQVRLQSRGLLPRLYPYEPLHVLTRRELDDLFDTTPDLTGADIDVSRFVREGEERDVTVWWWHVPEGESPHPRLRPSHEALCRVPIAEARKWLLGRRSGDDAGEAAGEGSSASSKRPRAWVWSYLDGVWEPLQERHLYPGQTILVDARAGGYDVEIGFTGKAGSPPPVVPAHARVLGAVDAADAADEQDELSEGLGAAKCQYKTIATHCKETANEAKALAEVLGLSGKLAKALELAGLAHDIGKAHPAFAAAIKDRNGIAPDVFLAKAPKGRWHAVGNLYDHSPLGRRPGFRHELASAFALLELVWRAQPDHRALQGGREELLEQTVLRVLPQRDEHLAKPCGLIASLLDLDEPTFNLVVYLVASHHGKVRGTLTMSPRDQDNPGSDGGLPIRGVRDGDELPELELEALNNTKFKLPAVRLSLDPSKLGLSARYGPSWVERVVSLREHYGTFQLAWLEALLRVADVRASQIAQPLDPRLPPERVEVAAIPESEDRDAELREWIARTLTAAGEEDDGHNVRARRPGRPARSRVARRDSARRWP